MCIRDRHNDSHLVVRVQCELTCSSEPGRDWIKRQAARLGIDDEAADNLFRMQSARMSVLTLREVSKWHANSDGGLLDAEEMMKIKLKLIKSELMGIWK